MPLTVRPLRHSERLAQRRRPAARALRTSAARRPRGDPWAAQVREQVAKDARTILRATARGASNRMGPRGNRFQPRPKKQRATASGQSTPSEARKLKWNLRRRTRTAAQEIVDRTAARRAERPRQYERRASRLERTGRWHDTAHADCLRHAATAIRSASRRRTPEVEEEWTNPVVTH